MPVHNLILVLLTSLYGLLLILQDDFMLLKCSLTHLFSVNAGICCFLCKLASRAGAESFLQISSCYLGLEPGGLSVFGYYRIGCISVIHNKTVLSVIDQFLKLLFFLTGRHTHYEFMNHPFYRVTILNNESSC